MAAAGSWRPLLCQDLHQRVLDLFEQGNYTDVCNLKDEVDVFVTVCEDRRSNADIVFLLGNAMLINKLNFEAIHYLKCAQSIHMAYSKESHVPSLSDSELTSAQIQWAEVCNALARAHAIVGEFAEAQVLLAQSMDIHNRLYNNKDDKILVMLELAQNSHQLGKYREAISIVDDIIAQTGGILAQASDIDLLSLSVLQSPICPMLLVAKCYAALGQYSHAVCALIRAREKAELQKDPIVIATVELEYAVMLWVRSKCIITSFRMMGKPFRLDEFTGPAMALNIVEWQFIQLIATECYATGNAPGTLGVCIQLNGSGNMVAVRKFDAKIRHLHQLVSVTWEKVEESQLNFRRFPRSIKFTCGLNDCAYTFEHGFEVHTRPLHFTKADTMLPLSSLPEFIDTCVAATQVGDPAMNKKNMSMVSRALKKAASIAAIHNITIVHDQARFYLAFLMFQRGDIRSESIGEMCLHNHLLNQVNDNIDADKCHWCDQQIHCMLKCEACLVMRFCCKKHQEMSWRPPFGSTLVAHKKTCQLLRMCRSAAKHTLQKGPEHPDTLSRAKIYKQAIRTFLCNDILETYLQNHDSTTDANSETNRDVNAHIRDA